MAHRDGEEFTGPTRVAARQGYVEENQEGWDGEVSKLEETRWDEDHDGAHLRA